MRISCLLRYDSIECVWPYFFALKKKKVWQTYVIYWTKEMITIFSKLHVCILVCSVLCLILNTSFVFELQQIFNYKFDALLSFDHLYDFIRTWTKLRWKLLRIHKTDTCIYCIIFQQSVKFDLNFNKKMFKHAYWFLISLCFLLSMLYILYNFRKLHNFGL